MCSVCETYEARTAAGTVENPIGPVAQSGRAPPWHGGGPGFKSRQVHLDAYMLAGFVAGEGSFIVTTRQPPFKDGTPRLRFVFQVTVAARDRPLLEQLRALLGFGSIRDIAPRNPAHQPLSELQIASRRAHFTMTIPWADMHLLPCAKRRQYELWRDALYSYDKLRPTRFGKGRSPCSVEGCDRPVRGRGLCRSHYYRATGY